MNKQTTIIAPAQYVSPVCKTVEVKASRVLCISDPNFLGSSIYGAEEEDLGTL